MKSPASEKPHQTTCSAAHVLTGYLLFIAIASLPLAVLLAAIFGVVIPVDEGRGRISGEEASLLELKALLIGALFAFAATFVAAAVPFAAMLIVAKRFQMHGWRYYALMSSASAAAMLGTLAILFVVLVHPSHPMPPSLSTLLPVVGVAVVVFWGVGGLAYWGYAHSRPPMSGWRASAASNGL